MQLTANVEPRARVERRERLVEQQHVGLARQRAGKRDALALAAAERRGPCIRQRGDPHALQQVVRAPRLGRREGDVAAHVEVREQAVLLRQPADAAPLGRQVDAGLRVEPGGVATGDPAAVGPPQPGDRAQHRRLAGARRPGEHERLRLDAQAEVDGEAAKPADELELERQWITTL